MGKKAQALAEDKPYPSMPDALEGLDEEVAKEKQAEEEAAEETQEQQQNLEQQQQLQEEHEQQANDEQSASTQDKGKQRALTTGLSHLKELEGKCFVLCFKMFFSDPSL